MKTCSCGAENSEQAAYCAACGRSLSNTADSSRSYSGGTVFGSYRLVREIGQGGMGRVFMAEHTRLGRLVALKILRSEYTNNVEAVTRFFAEARAVNRINHENIIEISDFVENEEGRSFYIMELLKGVDLHTLGQREGALDWRRAVAISVQICRGLGAAHAAGIVHRDLKPDNVFLTERGERQDFVKLLDFGVAKLIDDTLDDATSFKTTAGVVVGTPDYMSPEQASAGTAEPRSDIYSFGVILFEMVTGRLPFGATTAREAMVNHLMTVPPRPSKVPGLPAPIPQALEELILDCLKKQPGERPQDMTEVIARLEAIVARRTPPLGDRLWKTGWARGIFAAGLVGVGVAAMVVGRDHAPPPASERSSPPSGSAHELGATPAPTGTAVAAAAPTEAAAPPEPIEITFDTNPPGATVTRVGDSHALGVTPFTARLDRSPATVVFGVTKVGWRSQKKELVPLQSARVQIDLRSQDDNPARVVSNNAAGKARPPLPIRAAARSAKLDHSTVLNPFE